MIPATAFPYTNTSNRWITIVGYDAIAIAQVSGGAKLQVTDKNGIVIFSVGSAATGGNISQGFPSAVPPPAASATTLGDTGTWSLVAIIWAFPVPIPIPPKYTLTWIGIAPQDVIAQ